MSFFGTNPQDEYKDVVQANTVGLDPATLQKQNDFVAALQGQVAGTGPSVAGTMLTNAAQQNAKNAAGIATAQRGVNPGLALRTALNAGNEGFQQAAQTAAMARAQEELNATGQLGGQLNTMQGQNVGVQQANQQGQLAAAGINANLASGAATNNAGIVGGVIQGIGGSAAAGAKAMGGMAKGGMVKMAEGGDIAVAPIGYDPHLAPVDTSGAKALQQGIAGGMGAASKAISPSPQPPTPMTDAGFKMPQMGAQFATPSPSLGIQPFQSDVSRYLSGIAPGMSSTSPPAMTPSLGVATKFAQGGVVAAKVSPGERYLPPSAVKQVAEGKKSPMAAGEMIPGKPKVPGAKDDYRNDTVDKNLKSGGIVLPRHVTQAPDAPARAAKFVQAVLAKQGLRR